MNYEPVYSSKEGQKQTDRRTDRQTDRGYIDI